MKEPKRLRDEARGLEARLLASASTDVAPGDLHDDLHAALLVSATAVGIGTTTVVGLGANGSLAHAGAAVAAASNVTTGVAATGLATASMAGSLVALKWVGLGALVAVVSVGVRAAIVDDRPIPRPTAAVEAPRSVPTLATSQAAQLERVGPVPVPTSPAPHDMAVVAKPSVTVVAKPPVLSAPVVAMFPTPPKSTQREPSSARVDDMPRELSVLDEARAAVAAGDPTRALERLDLHARDFPDSRLAAEALALRVEAFAVAHDSARVRSLAESFVATYPDHPLVARMRALAKAAAL